MGRLWSPIAYSPIYGGVFDVVASLQPLVPDWVLPHSRTPLHLLEPSALTNSRVTLENLLFCMLNAPLPLFLVLLHKGQVRLLGCLLLHLLLGLVVSESGNLTLKRRLIAFNLLQVLAVQVSCQCPSTQVLLVNVVRAETYVFCIRDALHLEETNRGTPDEKYEEGRASSVLQ